MNNEHKPKMKFSYVQDGCFISPSNDVMDPQDVVEILDHYFVIQEQLKEAQGVIDFYANEKHWLYPGNDFHNFAIAKSDTDRVVRSNTKDTVSCGGRRARAFNKKYSR